jgi:hypothetical protein
MSNDINTELVIPISHIEFTVFGNAEIKRYSIANKNPFGINLPESYDNNDSFDQCTLSTMDAL